MKTKRIYIILTHTGTILSRIIKQYTKDEFSHVSISLDIGLKQMYSFGRLNPYNAFYGGFVHEYVNRGTFRRFYNTKAKILALNISEEQYEKIKDNIIKIKRTKKEYKFNTIGLFAAGFNISIGKEKSFYCAEFVKYIMENSGIDTKLPKPVKPDDFKNIPKLEEVYEGLLRKYKIEEKSIENFVN